MRSGLILMRILLATRGTTTDPLPLFSVRMDRQFVDIEAKHLDFEAEHLQERTVVGRRTDHLQQRGAPNDKSWVDQSWLSNAPRTQATTRTNQSDPYFRKDDDDEDYGDLPDSRTDDKDYMYPYVLIWIRYP